MQGYEPSMQNRDHEIQSVFEIADDSLQGILGHYYYTLAMKQAADQGNLLNLLPDKAIPHTFSWVRYYDKQELTREMQKSFCAYQSRVSLVLMTNVFEAVLGDLLFHLIEKGYPQELIHAQNRDKKKLGKENESYKRLLRWAYQESMKCDIGDESALARLPSTFGKIDNARRLRNLIVHNKGLFKERYNTDRIIENNIQVEMHPDYRIFCGNSQEKVPVILKPEDVEDFSRAHVEALHIIHNGIQKNYFGIAMPYDYRDERKKIEWNRIILGV
jgi:hypothetical protein